MNLLDDAIDDFLGGVVIEVDNAVIDVKQGESKTIANACIIFFLKIFFVQSFLFRFYIFHFNVI